MMILFEILFTNAEPPDILFMKHIHVKQFTNTRWSDL